MTDDLTIKQRKWLKEYIECGNATEAAMRVYDCKDRGSAANIGWENVRKLDFGELMEESGITDSKLRAKIEEGLGANKVVSARVGMNANERTDDFIEVPDYPTQHKFLETALKVKGKLRDKVDVNVSSVNLILDRLESDYDELGQKAGEQMVAIESSIQNQGQNGQSGNIPAELPPVEALEGEGLPQEELDS